jgi:hypothetical protein
MLKKRFYLNGVGITLFATNDMVLITLLVTLLVTVRGKVLGKVLGE